MIIALLLASSSPFASQRLDNPTSTIVSNRPHPGTFLLTLACLLLCVRQDSPEQDRWRFKGLRCSILLEQLALHRPITASHFAWHSECITHCSCTSAANRPLWPPSPTDLREERTQVCACATCLRSRSPISEVCRSDAEVAGFHHCSRLFLARGTSQRSRDAGSPKEHWLTT